MSQKTNIKSILEHSVSSPKKSQVGQGYYSQLQGKPGTNVGSGFPGPQIITNSLSQVPLQNQQTLSSANPHHSSSLQQQLLSQQNQQQKLLSRFPQQPVTSQQSLQNQFLYQQQASQTNHQNQLQQGSYISLQHTQNSEINKSSNSNYNNNNDHKLTDILSTRYSQGTLKNMRNDTNLMTANLRQLSSDSLNIDNSNSNKNGGNSSSSSKLASNSASKSDQVYSPSQIESKSNSTSITQQHQANFTKKPFINKTKDHLNQHYSHSNNNQSQQQNKMNHANQMSTTSMAISPRGYSNIAQEKALGKLSQDQSQKNLIILSSKRPPSIKQQENDASPHSNQHATDQQISNINLLSNLTLLNPNNNSSNNLKSTQSHVISNTYHSRQNQQTHNKTEQTQLPSQYHVQAGNSLYAAVDNVITSSKIMLSSLASSTGVVGGLRQSKHQTSHSVEKYRGQSEPLDLALQMHKAILGGKNNISKKIHVGSGLTESQKFRSKKSQAGQVIRSTVFQSTTHQQQLSSQNQQAQYKTLQQQLNQTPTSPNQFQSMSNQTVSKSSTLGAMSSRMQTNATLMSESQQKPTNNTQNHPEYLNKPVLRHEQNEPNDKEEPTVSRLVTRSNLSRNSISDQFRLSQQSYNALLSTQHPSESQQQPITSNPQLQGPQYQQQPTIQQSLIKIDQTFAMTPQAAKTNYASPSITAKSTSKETSKHQIYFMQERVYSHNSKLRQLYFITKEERGAKKNELQKLKRQNEKSNHHSNNEGYSKIVMSNSAINSSTHVQFGSTSVSALQKSQGSINTENQGKKVMTSNSGIGNSSSNSYRQEQNNYIHKEEDSSTALAQALLQSLKHCADQKKTDIQQFNPTPSIHEKRNSLQFFHTADSQINDLQETKQIQELRDVYAFRDPSEVQDVINRRGVIPIERSKQSKEKNQEDVKDLSQDEWEEEKKKRSKINQFHIQENTSGDKQKKQTEDATLKSLSVNVNERTKYFQSLFNNLFTKETQKDKLNQREISTPNVSCSPSTYSQQIKSSFDQVAVCDSPSVESFSYRNLPPRVQEAISFLKPTESISDEKICQQVRSNSLSSNNQSASPPSLHEPFVDSQAIKFPNKQNEELRKEGNWRSPNHAENSKNWIDKQQMLATIQKQILRVLGDYKKREILLQDKLEEQNIKLTQLNQLLSQRDEEILLMKKQGKREQVQRDQMRSDLIAKDETLEMLRDQLEILQRSSKTQKIQFDSFSTFRHSMPVFSKAQLRPNDLEEHRSQEALNESANFNGNIHQDQNNFIDDIDEIKRKYQVKNNSYTKRKHPFKNQCSDKKTLVEDTNQVLNDSFELMKQISNKKQNKNQQNMHPQSQDIPILEIENAQDQIPNTNDKNMFESFSKNTNVFQGNDSFNNNQNLIQNDHNTFNLNTNNHNNNNNNNNSLNSNNQNQNFSQKNNSLNNFNDSFNNNDSFCNIQAVNINDSLSNHNKKDSFSTNNNSNNLKNMHAQNSNNYNNQTYEKSINSKINSFSMSKDTSNKNSFCAETSFNKKDDSQKGENNHFDFTSQILTPFQNSEEQEQSNNEKSGFKQDNNAKIHFSKTKGLTSCEIDLQTQQKTTTSAFQTRKSVRNNGCVMNEILTSTNSPFNSCKDIQSANTHSQRSLNNSFGNFNEDVERSKIQEKQDNFANQKEQSYQFSKGSFCQEYKQIDTPVQCDNPIDLHSNENLNISFKQLPQTYSNQDEDIPFNFQQEEEEEEQQQTEQQQNISFTNQSFG